MKTAVLFATIALTFACAAPMGCSQTDSQQQIESETGTFSAALTTTSPAGVLYRLRNATFSLQGADNATVASDGYLSEQSVSLELTVGPYDVSISDGWYLERQTATVGQFETIAAQLNSPNPTSFVVGEGETTNVVFYFQTAEGPITLGSGSVNLSFVVADVVENTDAACSDGIDNDADSYVDCDDFNCIGTVACGATITPENTEAACADGIDNDADSYVDCNDYNCSGTVACGVTVTLENTAAACSDSIDNDGDSYIDCDDFNCRGTVACG